MALLDEWNQEISGVVAEPSSSAIQQQGYRTEQSSLFSLDVRLDFAAQGRGHSIAFACTNSKIFLATSRNYVIRHDSEVGHVDELEISKATQTFDAKIRRMFVDPAGLHVLLLVQQGLTTEVMYIDQSFTKPRLIQKLKRVGVTSVAWNPVATQRGLWDVLIGTDRGEVYLLTLIEKKEVVEVLGSVHGSQSPIAGMAHLAVGRLKVGGGSRLAILLCGTHLYLYSSAGTKIKNAFIDDTGQLRAPKMFDLPIEQGAAQLQLYRPSEITADGFLVDPTDFAVLSTSGIYYGKLDLSTEVEDPLDHLISHKLLPSALFNGGSQERPISLALTQHHLVLLYPSKIQFINKVSKKIVQQILIDTFASPMRGDVALPLGLCRDVLEGQLLVLAGDDVYEIDCSREDNDMWKVFLEKGDYHAALPYCRTPMQRNTAYLQQAERLLKDGQVTEAATLFGKCTSKRPSFEEVTMRLMQVGESTALKAFLAAKLSTLGRDDRIQMTMVSTWMLELLLDIANKAALSDIDNNTRSDETFEEADEEVSLFLIKHVKDLDPKTTISLLEGYGRDKDLITFARARGDHEAELELLVKRGQAERVLELLRKPSVSRELVYKYASSLVALAPSQTIFSWMNASPPLEPLKLLPALLQYAEPTSLHAARVEAIRFLKFCIEVRGVTDPALHDFNVAVLSVDDENEENLLDYIETSRYPTGDPMYDPVRALRLCQSRGRKKATVYLLAEVSMWLDAVQMALDIDKNLAVEIARRYSGEEGHIRKEIWLAIVKSLIKHRLPEDRNEKLKVINEVQEIMAESKGSVCIDDVLPLLPNFEEIGVFKDLICSSLRSFSEEISSLKEEMQTASDATHKLREIMSKVKKRRGEIDATSCRCISCSRLLVDRPPARSGPSGGFLPQMYLFPTGNAYHGSCLCFEVIKLVPTAQQKVIEKLSQSLASVTQDSLGEIQDSVKKDIELLEREIAIEDPFCGERISTLVTKPFVEEKEDEQLFLDKTWSIYS